MDQDKHAYFLAKFRMATDEEFQEAASRVHEMADEAAKALRQVASEKGVSLPADEAKPLSAAKELTAEERAKQTLLATSLWNSSVSKHVEYMFGAQALMFSFVFLGRDGLRVGVLWILPFAALLGWGAYRLGRRYTRSVCADEGRSIQEKQKSLKTAALILWPALLMSAFAGLALASALRGA